MDRLRWQPVRRSRIWLVACGLAVLAIGLLGWRAFVPAERPHVLLITLDTTRADRIGCYGYAPALTPTLDALAAEGVLFERAYTPAPLTLPSHASMMTGLYPPEHGLIINGRGRLDEKIPTLAETLRVAGYDTGAFIGSFVLHSKFGLARGFREYDDDMSNTDPTHDGLHRQRDGARVVDAALAWLEKRRAKPFFCWVHLYDAHAPYNPHADEFGDRFHDSPYDGGMAYVDQQVTRLVKHLRENGLIEQTLIVIVGDHGEGLGDHNEQQHGLTLYNNVAHVPWIWAGRGVTAGRRRVPQPTSLIDLRPTLLQTLGISDTALGDGGATRGRSLRAALQGGQIAARDCYSATDFPLLEHGWSPQRCLTTADWKYIRSPEVELYDLSSDPQEKNNLAANRPDQVQIMEDQLAALERSMETRQGKDVVLSPRERQALASLGYLGGSNSEPKPAAPGDVLPDVKRMLPLSNKLEEALRLFSGGDVPAAEERLREISREAPDYIPAKLSLAEALTHQQKFAESREVTEGILKQDPDSSEAHFQLGAVYSAQRQFAEAAVEFRKSLDIKPTAVGVMVVLGQALVQLGRIDEAEETYNELLEQDPLFVNAHVELGMILAAQRREAEAEQHYRDALKYTPTSMEAHANLAILLARQNRPGEAGVHFQRAIELAPKNAELQFNYSAFLMAQGRRDEAIRALEETLRLDPQHPHAKNRLQQVRSTEK